MTEDEARSYLEQLQNTMRSRDILYTETRFRDKDSSEFGFVEAHIRKIKKGSDGAWDTQVAKRYLANLKNSIDEEFKTDS